MTTKGPEGWASDPNARGLRVERSPDHTLLLPFDQFVYAELTQEGETQQLHLAFATHEVFVRGYSLRRLVTALQRQELCLIALLPKPIREAIPDGQPVIGEIRVVEVKDPESAAPGQPTP